MAKDAVFTLKLEPQLRDAFIAEAQAAHRPASQVVRDLMREFVLADMPPPSPWRVLERSPQAATPPH